MEGHPPPPLVAAAADDDDDEKGEEATIEDVEEEGTEAPRLPSIHKKEEEVDAEEATAAIVVNDNTA